MTPVPARIAGSLQARRHVRALRHMPAIALVLMAAACADLERLVTATDARETQPAPFTGGSRQQREAEMNRQWQNRPLADLLATAGEPELTMNIPGGGNPPGFVVVYGLHSRSGCIDAFAVSTGTVREPTVRVYHCR